MIVRMATLRRPRYQFGDVPAMKAQAASKAGAVTRVTIPGRLLYDATWQYVAMARSPVEETPSP